MRIGVGWFVAIPVVCAICGNSADVSMVKHELIRYCIWDSYCQNQRRIPQNFPLFGMIWYGWIQSSAVSKRKDVRSRSFPWLVPLSIDYVGNSSIGKAISNPSPSCSSCVWNSCCQNHSRNQSNFLLFSMILCGWIQSSTEHKRQDVWWSSFRSLIPLSIDYVWNVCIDRVI